MRIASASILLASLAMLGVACPDPALAQGSSDPVLYRMAHGSEMVYGCFDSCECVIVHSGPLTGEFFLQLTGVSPLYDHYEVRNIAWTYATGDTGTEFTAHATGHGTYDRGGEVALMQRMVLDLTIQVEQAPPYMQHYDSGLVPVQAPFPAIDIDVRLRVDACRETLFRVIAKPAGSASTPRWPGPRLLRSATPNPTTSDIEVLFVSRAAGRARVEVVDVHGRVVASLIDAEVGIGPHLLRWGGRDARGADVGAGIFWITAQAGGEADRVRIARLR